MKKDIEKVYNQVVSKKAKGSPRKFYLSHDPNDTKVLELEDGTKINLTRIVAGRDIFNKKGTKVSIPRGTIGGYVESEANLSQLGMCWILHDAIVFGDAVVKDDAIVKNRAMVCGSAEVSGKAIVSKNAVIRDNAVVTGYAKVSGFSQIYDNAQVIDYSKISGHAQVLDNAKILSGEVKDDAVISGYVRGHSTVSGRAYIYKGSVIDGSVISQDAKVGKCVVSNSVVSGMANISYATIKEGSEISGNTVLKGEHLTYEDKSPASTSIYIKSSKITGDTVVINKLKTAPDYSYQNHIFDSVVTDAKIEDNVWIINANINGVTLVSGEYVHDCEVSPQEEQMDVECTQSSEPDLQIEETPDYIDIKHTPQPDVNLDGKIDDGTCQ